MCFQQWFFQILIFVNKKIHFIHWYHQWKWSQTMQFGVGLWTSHCFKKFRNSESPTKTNIPQVGGSALQISTSSTYGSACLRSGLDSLY